MITNKLVPIGMTSDGDYEMVLVSDEHKCEQVRWDHGLGAFTVREEIIAFCPHLCGRVRCCGFSPIIKLDNGSLFCVFNCTSSLIMRWNRLISETSEA